MTTLIFPILCEQPKYKNYYNIFKSYNLDVADDIKLIVFTSFHIILFSI